MSISICVRNDSLHVLWKNRHEYPSIGDGRSDTFLLRAEQPGTYQVQLKVPDRYNQAAALITVVVTAPAQRHLNTVALGVLVVLAVAVLHRRRRRVTPARRRPVLPLQGCPTS